MKLDLAIEQGNNLMEEFMGYYKSCDFYGRDTMFINKAPVKTEKGKKTRYHTSWDWLMSVVDKIESEDLFQVIIKPQWVKIQYYNPFNPKDIAVQGIPPNTKKEAVWKCVVEFITWYNKAKKNDKDQHMEVS